MRQVFSFALYILSSLLIIGCSSLKEPIIQQFEPITSYRYFFVTPTTVLTSSNGGVFGNKYGVYGGSVTNSLNPSDVISGTLIKQGMIRLPQLDPDLLDQTVIVNYGESGRRNLNLGYSIEVTIQILQANTHSVICTCTAEGQGSTEADDIRIAINRALEPLFNNNPHIKPKKKTATKKLYKNSL